MSNRTNIYKFLYLQEGDKWYPGHDYENMLTVENQLQELYKIVGTGVKSGWEVTKLSDERTDQINLLDGYLKEINLFQTDKQFFFHLSKFLQ